MNSMKKHTLTAKLLAWSVHLLTASGIIFAFLAILAVQAKDFKMAMLWLVIALFVDGIDGTFARLFKVKEVLPNFDGNSIDHVIDFLTYAVIPAYFIYQSDILPSDFNIKMIGISAILLSATYYYGKTSYMTEDFYFEGFPVMWNVVGFYFYLVSDFSQMVNLILIIIIAILHFVPWKYPYPSRTQDFKWWNIGASAITFGVLFIAFFQFPDISSWLSILAHLMIVYFMGMTLYVTYLKK